MSAPEILESVKAERDDLRQRLAALVEFLIESHQRADDDWGAVYYVGREIQDAIEAAKGGR